MSESAPQGSQMPSVTTPLKPVSYKNAATDANNGFGTLAEAG